MADGAHRAAHKVDVHLGGVLLELEEDLRRLALEGAGAALSQICMRPDAEMGGRLGGALLEPQQHLQRVHTEWLGCSQKLLPLITTVGQPPLSTASTPSSSARGGTRQRPAHHTWSMLRSEARRVMMSSFSILT